MKTLKELVELKSELDLRIARARETEGATALAQIHELVKSFGFTPAQVFPLPGADRVRLKPKYQDPVSGATWSGVGKPPKWIAGVQDRSDFEIKPETPVFTRSEFADPKNPFPVQ